MSRFYTPPPQVIDGDVAYAEDVNDINNESDSGFTGVAAEIDQINADMLVPIELAMAWAVNPEDVEVEPGLYSSYHYSRKASDSADVVSGIEAIVQAIADDAQQSADDAAVSAADAALSAIDAEESAQKAEEAADAPTDYDNGVTYNYPDRVIASNFATYRCIGTNVVGDDPVTSSTGDWNLETWIPAVAEVKTTSFTAVANYRYYLDTSSTALVVTLPTSPQNGDTINLVDTTGNWKDLPAQVLHGTHNIMGLAEDLYLDVNNAYITLVYVSSITDWRLS